MLKENLSHHEDVALRKRKLLLSKSSSCSKPIAGQSSSSAEALQTKMKIRICPSVILQERAAGTLQDCVAGAMQAEATIVSMTMELEDLRTALTAARAEVSFRSVEAEAEDDLVPRPTLVV